MKLQKSSNPTAAGARPLAGFCLSTCALGSFLALAAGAQEERFEYNGWLDLTVGGAVVDGNKAAFQQRHQTPATAFGGVDSFFWEKMFENTTLRIEGRGIFYDNDYQLKIDYSNPDVGYVRAGYRQFRTWHDGEGGFFPPAGLRFSLYDHAHHLDRGDAWIETGLTLPDWPVISLRYSHQYRRGEKGSTSWGDTQRTAGANTRNIVPSFRGIDESRHIFEGKVTHTLGRTDFGAAIRYEFSDQENSLNMRRRPGEAQDRHLTQREGVETDILSTHAWTRSQLHEKVTLTTGYLFSTLDTDLSGSRIYGPDYDPVYDPAFARRQSNDSGFFGLEGGSQVKQHVANLNLMFTPWEHLFIVPSVRVERQNLDSSVDFIETSVAGNLTSSQSPRSAMSDREVLSVSERLELRYTGLPTWVLYARGDWTQGQGSLSEQRINAATGATLIDRYTDDERMTQQYTVGANWYPWRAASFAAQYYHKRRDNSYDHIRDTTSNAPASGDRYPAVVRSQDFRTDDVNFRVTLRPAANLTLVSRYDFQVSTIDNRAVGLAAIESGRMTSHIFSQSVTWMPLTRLYLQGSVNYAIDRTETPANDITGANEAANRVWKSRNDYLNSSITAGFALNDKTDLDVTYVYYFADNYRDNSAFSVPFGTGEHEHSITAGILHRIKENLLCSVKYGFFSYREDTWGGNRNYDAHLVYSSLSWRF